MRAVAPAVAAWLALSAVGCSATSAGGGGEEARERPDSAGVAVLALDTGKTVLQCEPPRGDLPPEVEARDLAGEYRLILEARSGPRTGARATGELRLAPWEGSTPEEMSEPPVLYGSTTVNPAAVGAADTGDTASREPQAPGALVFQHPAYGGGTAITLRLGSKANRLDMLVFDGAYTALRVRGVGPRGFHGVWDSGPKPAAGGHFCAERL